MFHCTSVNRGTLGCTSEFWVPFGNLCNIYGAYVHVSKLCLYVSCAMISSNDSANLSISQPKHTKKHHIDGRSGVILPFRIRRATSVPLGKGTKFALHHGKMSTTKRRAIQILHISMFQFTFKCGYNDFISKYTYINSLHVTQIDLFHDDTFCST